jgi:inorganic pyrophosphatase
MMQYISVIEMPKGEDRRIHLSYNSGEGFIDLGPIIDQIPVNDGVMPVHYGYIEGVINEVEKDNVDVLIFSNDIYKTGDKVEIDIIGMLNREDGDHKVLAFDKTLNLNSFDDISEEERNLILKYFGYKSKILSINTRQETLKYLQDNKIQ